MIFTRIRMQRLEIQLVTTGASTSFRQTTFLFGTTITAKTTGNSNQVFTSYDRSSVTGLDYAVNRTYSNGQGRFTQVDPIAMASASIGNPQSNNLYAYTQNMPTDFVDPSGLQMVPFTRRVCLPWDGGPRICFDVMFHWMYIGGSGGGNVGGPGGGENPKPNEAQCEGIRELLRREKKYGTLEAAKRSSMEFGGSTRLQSLQNEINGIVWVNGNPLDIDWLITLNSTLSSVSNGLPFYAGSPAVSYALGKSIWQVSKLVTGRESENPIPFTEAGERNAVWYAQSRYKFAEIFTTAWLKSNCNSGKEAIGRRR